MRLSALLALLITRVSLTANADSDVEDAHRPDAVVHTGRDGQRWLAVVAYPHAHKQVPQILAEPDGRVPDLAVPNGE